MWSFESVVTERRHELEEGALYAGFQSQLAREALEVHAARFLQTLDEVRGQGRSHDVKVRLCFGRFRFEVAHLLQERRALRRATPPLALRKHLRKHEPQVEQLFRLRLAVPPHCCRCVADVITCLLR